MFASSLLRAIAVIFSLIIIETSAQTATSKAETGLATLQEWYNNETGIWNTCGWWNGANCLTMLADFAAIDSSVLDTAVYVFNNSYVIAPTVNPAPGVQKEIINGLPHTTYPSNWPNASNLHHHPQNQGTVNATAWLDGYYDDDAWWALAWIAAYDATQTPEYLELAIGIFEALVSMHNLIRRITCSLLRPQAGLQPAAMAGSGGTQHTRISTQFQMSSSYPSQGT